MFLLDRLGEGKKTPDDRKSRCRDVAEVAEVALVGSLAYRWPAGAG